MKCEEYNKMFYLYRYNLLSDKKRNRFEKHLGECINCQKAKEIASYKMEFFNITMPEQKTDEFLDNKILAAVRQKEFEKKPLISNIFNYYFKPAFALAILFVITFFGYNYYKVKYDLGELKTINNVKIEKTKISGKDGLYRKVFISVPENGFSKLKKDEFYDIEIYEGTEISISKGLLNNYDINLINGTAFFEVKKNKSKMKISTGNADIYITGTKFSVYTSEEQSITEVELYEGSIEIINKKIPENVQKIKNISRIAVIGEDLPVIPDKKIDDIIEKSKKRYIFRERVFLRDGNVIIGNIIEQDEKNIFIRTKVGYMQFKINDIKKIEYIITTNSNSFTY